MTKYFTKIQIKALNRMRERFLAGTAGARDYWQLEEDLALYDSTYGERIGWKWDAVLSELQLRGWSPKSRHAVDWGCGSGIAGRRVLATWSTIHSLSLYDRSSLAIRYASERARTANPNTQLRPLDNPGPGTLLLASHVANELPDSVLDSLLATAAQVSEIIWVEAGTHADSRRLIEIRERLLPLGFNVIGPCTHAARCGMLTPNNERHWCHNFATPPSEVFQDARWAEFGKEIGIDLRSLPYSFLALSKHPVPHAAGFSRVIGEPREAKGFSRVLSCQQEGVTEFMLQKRDAPEIYKELHKGRSLPVYRWQLEEGKIKAGESLVAPQA